MARLHVETRGDPNAPSLVLVHALGTDHRFWEEAVADLSHDFHCVTPDLQAAGRTPIPASPVDAERHAADLAEMIYERDLGRVVLAGCAIGGMVAAICAANNPDICAGLVMTNPGLRNQDEVKVMLRARTDTVREHGMSVLLPGAPEKSFHEMPRDDRFARFVKRYGAQDPEGYASSVLGFLDIDIRPVLPRLKCPLLLIPGGKDILMPPEGAGEIAERVPHAEILPFDDTAHFIPYQAPDRFAAVLRRFAREKAAW
jgi:3-oxoadipate enol-lactonase